LQIDKGLAFVITRISLLARTIMLCKQDVEIRKDELI